MIWGGQFVNYGWNLDDQIYRIQITQPSVATAVGYLYDDLGRRTTITRLNGVTTSYAYDPGDRLLTLAHDLPGTASDQTYGFTWTPRTRSNGARAPTRSTTTPRWWGLRTTAAMAGARPPPPAG